MSDLIERLKEDAKHLEKMGWDAAMHDIYEAITALSPTLPDEDYQAVKQKASELQEELNAEIKISNERWDRIEELEALLEPSLEVRDKIANFVMNKFNSVPKGGSFWFDIHDAEDLIAALQENEL